MLHRARIQLLQEARTTNRKNGKIYLMQNNNYFYQPFDDNTFVYMLIIHIEKLPK